MSEHHHHHDHHQDPTVEGKDFLHITEQKLDIEQITSVVASPKAGAISTFLGVTRDHHAGKKVRFPSYALQTLNSKVNHRVNVLTASRETGAQVGIRSLCPHGPE